MRILLVEDDALLGDGTRAGLRLAIVKRVAELHGAQLELANHPDGGFLARILWPASPIGGGRVV